MAFFSDEQLVGLDIGEIRSFSDEIRSHSPLDNPAVPPTTQAVWEWFTDGNPTESGERINHNNAIQITTVYQVVTLIAKMASAMTLRLMERANGAHIEAVDNNIHYLLSMRANPYQSGKKFIEQFVGCMAYTGNGYAQIERNTYGQPVALWMINPLKTDIVKVDLGLIAKFPELRLQVGELVFTTTDGEKDGQFRLVPYMDMLHVPLFAVAGVKGLSPIAAARQALGLASAAEKFGARHFGNSTGVPAILFNKGNPTDKQKLENKQSWERTQGGRNQGKTAILYGADWSYEKIGLTPEECQFLATRGYQRADIAALWGVSPHLVGDTSRLSGTNSEQLMIQLLTLTLNPYLGAIEDEFAYKLCAQTGRKAFNFFFSFDTSELLRTDVKSQMDSYYQGRIGGWFSANDIRKKMGENPGDSSLDVYIVPVNYQNSQLLLSTESIQDQPIGGAKPDAVSDEPPTPAERSMLGGYTRSYIHVYSDAFRRLSKRSTKDYDAVNALFRPVLRSIADYALDSRNGAFPIPGDPIDGVITDSLRAMAKRVSKWPDVIPEGEMANYANAEFLRAVRSLHIAVTRESAVAAAIKQLESKAEEPEDAETD